MKKPVFTLAVLGSFAALQPHQHPAQLAHFSATLLQGAAQQAVFNGVDL